MENKAQKINGNTERKKKKKKKLFIKRMQITKMNISIPPNKPHFVSIHCMHKGTQTRYNNRNEKK